MGPGEPRCAAAGTRRHGERARSAAACAKPAAALATGKKLFYQQIDIDMEQAYQLASQVITDNMLGDDALEGAVAFVEKRQPRWNRK